MANNLNQFFTEIADAIRAQQGYDPEDSEEEIELLCPLDFPELIRNL